MLYIVEIKDQYQGTRELHIDAESEYHATQIVENMGLKVVSVYSY